MYYRWRFGKFDYEHASEVEDVDNEEDSSNDDINVREARGGVVVWSHILTCAGDEEMDGK